MTAIRLTLVAAVLHGLVACGEAETKPAPEPEAGRMPTEVPEGTGGTTGTLPPATPTGAGGMAVDPTARFIGEWSAVSGTRTAQCDADPAETTPLAPYSRRVGADPNAALNFVGTCPTPIILDVAGDTATARSGQGCSGYIAGTDIRVAVTVLRSTMTGADGHTMTIEHEELRQASNATGSAVCLVSQEGTLIRNP